MPLSDEEARLLHQLEQSLAAEDPDFASTLRGSKLMAHNRRVALLAVLGFIAGIAILFGGAVSKQTWLGVFGFVAMLASAYVFTIAWRRGIGGPEDQHGTPAGGGSRGGRPGRQSKRSGSFVDRMEERWQRRRDGDGL
ncbi:DUF3040 domain-containing protein [Aeromicrobium sp. SMF47]|uniref:DUF3040 domain-containing protein n=1 Tax=Aeromicrobium yanjiei TaxID=2662028 RepID=A0A5Q2MDB2_9ACTN|nr:MULTISPECIES: DUF3040 domain-containing protein [Aeromicrobium]MRJ77806.1 DUF3040 domain-containing protein [Aeromicrobium yanjiei]MRK02175.1 DUF3040 domain-containing protein [Aeromicrobium sp. S22]QGG41104.1 DUF3040 domain-containing protein [Aeromicrobium yanjiei]